jgi:hypothetical protein
MKPTDQDRLLSEILNDGEAANFRAASLARGLDFLQRRRRRKRLAQAGAVLLLSGLLILGLFVHPASGPSPTARMISWAARQRRPAEDLKINVQHPATPPVVRAAAAAPATDTGKVQIITDEELFALFPNRAMALIGAPGHQRLVFLDHGVASEQP